MIVTDCGASSTLTGSLINTTDVGEGITLIETADGKESMRVSQNCLKSYYVQNRMGELTRMTVPALYVKGLPQDLLGGKALNKENIRLILDSDQDICGLYPLDNDCEQHRHTSIEFFSEPGRDTDLFYLQSEEMGWTTNEKLTSWDMWHRRHGHGPYQTLKDTIDHVIGMKNLKGKQFDPQEKCPSCMVGKSTLEDYPELLTPQLDRWKGYIWIYIHLPSYPSKDISIPLCLLIAMVDSDGNMD